MRQLFPSCGLYTLTGTRWNLPLARGRVTRPNISHEGEYPSLYLSLPFRDRTPPLTEAKEEANNEDHISSGYAIARINFRDPGDSSYATLQNQPSRASQNLQHVPELPDGQITFL
jgi:hypothetical protein